MAHTKEQRDKMALCGAKKKNGETCRAYAGQGTSHPGIGQCKFHFGNARNNRVAAVKQEAQRRAVEFGQPIEISPAEALLSTVYLSAGHLAFVRDELGAIGNGRKLTDEQKFEKDVLLRQYNDERDRLARTSKLALDAGVAERIVQLAERHGEVIANVMRAILTDPELGLTAAQHEVLPDLVRRHLTLLESHEQRALTG
jgi:hypothetical protein